MILTRLPDLPPSPETPANATFRRDFYRRWGKENSIVCGSARRAEYRPYQQRLSIKTVFSGREHYYVDGRRLTVTDETWLVLNDDREYGSLLEAPRAAFSFCIFFRPGIAGEIAGAARLGAGSALDVGADVDPAPVEFAEHLRPHDRTVSPVLKFIRRQVLAGVHDANWCEEQFVFLLGRLLSTERTAARMPERIDCVRPATRKELVKRIRWSTDFMHSNLHRDLSLADIAAAARLSSFHFLRTFRQVHGMTPMTYLRMQRTQRALALLASTQLGVGEIAGQVGLSRLALYRHVRCAKGEGPRCVRRRGEPECDIQAV